MRTSAAVRRLGVLGIVCGLVIVGMMGTITWNMSWVLKHPGQQDYGGSRFTGDAAQAAMILQLFWVVICFGVAAIGAGLLQAVTGRRHRFVVIGVLVLGAILFLVARQTMVALR